jgi:transcriptional regulator
MTDFNLSDKIYENATDMGLDVVYTDDVKEFIRLLKEELPTHLWDGHYASAFNVHIIINKLAGERLI